MDLWHMWSMSVWSKLHPQDQQALHYLHLLPHRYGFQFHGQNKMPNIQSIVPKGSMKLN